MKYVALFLALIIATPAVAYDFHDKRGYHHWNHYRHVHKHHSRVHRRHSAHHRKRIVRHRAHIQAHSSLSRMQVLTSTVAPWAGALQIKR